MMPSARRFLVMLASAFLRARAGGALALFASAVPLAHADVVVSFAESPVSVIRGASLYRTGEGARLRDDDIIETDAGKSAQLEDSAGTLIALGPQTQILLKTPSAPQNAVVGPLRITMLSGWLKVGCNVSAGAQPPLSIELHGLDIKPSGNGPWSVVATTTGERAAIFAESGDDEIVVVRAPAQVPRQILHAGQYLERHADGPLRAQARPSAEFIGAMPPGFRDPLVGVAGRLASRHELAAPLRAVDYADVSDWLTSSVSERATFVKRFVPRLKTAAFRAQVDTHLDVLPEWRPILHPPPPRPASEPHKRPAQAPPLARPESGAGSLYRDKPTPDDADDAH
ncbi:MULTISPECIES: hypothetical protein [unclassified Paraburkholderia]|uniref:hypothetical protein n=1 Tax=unclassified Paraburkholderia TaxID=2615204 RepID=UPI001609434F|nr:MULTISPECIES: hypothetical protein [unclassified Paraburkholderia]MBB5447193.1 hypothetical protein [Paraburkholderia sp. WSM4177]MBB5487702.1 hypothetical protein [Paraburkholderia sp. WSM4180]